LLRAVGVGCGWGGSVADPEMSGAK
jgi:hypothetical protein